MNETARVALRTPSEDAAADLVREYVVDAVDRLRDRDDCTLATFVFDQDEDDPRGESRHDLLLILRGDTDAIRADERERWEALVDDGLATDWEHAGTIADEDHPVEETSEARKALAFDLSRATARMGVAAYDELDAFPAPVETYPDEPGEYGDVGWWELLHSLTVQANYSLDEEIDVYAKGIEHSLRNVAEHDDPDAAMERLDALVDDLESKREEIRSGRLDT